MAKKNKQRHPAKCVVKIDGREILDFYPYLERVSVETSRKSASVSTLTFASVRDKAGNWNIQDNAMLTPWKKIYIEADFGGDKQEIMRGFIRDIKMDYPDDMNAKVNVTCQDESILLDRTHVRKTYSEADQPLKDDELIKELLKPHWTGDKVKASEGTTCGDLYLDDTIIKLIKRRAALNGYEFLVRGGKAYFGPPQLEGDPQPAILVYAGPASNCFNISVRHDGHSPDGVLYSGAAEDGGDEKINSGEYSSKAKLLGNKPANSEDSGLDPFRWHSRTPPGSTPEEREVYAKARAEEASWKIVATGELDGSVYGHVLLTNETVEVDGIGNTYGGIWYVDEVKHQFSAEGYRQSFKLIRNATGKVDLKADQYALSGALKR